jgi:hypothetical protein
MMCNEGLVVICDGMYFMMDFEGFEKCGGFVKSGVQRLYCDTSHQGFKSTSHQ